MPYEAISYCLLSVIQSKSLLHEVWLTWLCTSKGCLGAELHVGRLQFQSGDHVIAL